ncbi:MAG: IPT/TIG domain-containing protein, partial [Elusimicrobiota bacterium]
WGKKLFSGISAGMAVKYNRQALANKVYSAYAMDLGLLWNPISRLNLGLAYSNLGTDVATSLLDSGWRVGASYGVNDSLLLALSSELKPDGFDRLQMGVEGLINSIIALRAGYVYNFTASKLDSTSGITAGMGVRILKNIMFDYAYLSFGELGGSHRVSLTYKFWCPNKAIEEQAKRIAEIKPVPIITGISPTLGPVTGKTMVVITGSGFKNITETNGVKFGGVNAMNYTVDSDTQITAVSPAHAAGIVNIVVISTVGASSTVLEDSYTYYIPAPMISGINPTFGPAAGGTTVVITGSGFNGITGVAGIKFATLNATSYTVDSDTQITAVSPAHAAGTINIVATSPVGASPIVPEDFYTYSAPPAPKVQPTVIILEKLILFEDTHFEFDSSTLTKDGARIVVENTQVLKDNPVAKIRIAGYASASGTEEYNQKLSERRASAIKEILVKVGGISQDRITTIGYGETRPAMFEPIPAHIDSMEAQANMRVLFEIIVK